MNVKQNQCLKTPKRKKEINFTPSPSHPNQIWTPVSLRPEGLSKKKKSKAHTNFDSPYQMIKKSYKREFSLLHNTSDQSSTSLGNNLELTSKLSNSTMTKTEESNQSESEIIIDDFSNKDDMTYNNHTSTLTLSDKQRWTASKEDEDLVLSKIELKQENMTKLFIKYNDDNKLDHFNVNSDDIQHTSDDEKDPNDNFPTISQESVDLLSDNNQVFIEKNIKLTKTPPNNNDQEKLLERNELKLPQHLNTSHLDKNDDSLLRITPAPLYNKCRKINTHPLPARTKQKISIHATRIPKTLKIHSCNNLKDKKTSPCTNHDQNKSINILKLPNPKIQSHLIWQKDGLGGKELTYEQKKSMNTPSSSSKSLSPNQIPLHIQMMRNIDPYYEQSTSNKENFPHTKSDITKSDVVKESKNFYKYENVVRQKDQRAQMHGDTCDCCIAVNFNDRFFFNKNLLKFYFYFIDI